MSPYQADRLRTAATPFARLSLVALRWAKVAPVPLRQRGFRPRPTAVLAVHPHVIRTKVQQMKFLVILSALIAFSCKESSRNLATIVFTHSASFDKEIEIAISPETDSTWIVEWEVSGYKTDSDSFHSQLERFTSPPNQKQIIETMVNRISKNTFEKIEGLLYEIDPFKIKKETLRVGTDGTWWTVRAVSWSGYIVEYRFSVAIIKGIDNQLNRVLDLANEMFKISGHNLSDYYKIE